MTLRLRRTRSALCLGTVFAVAALVLASCGSPSNAVVNTNSGVTISPAELNPSSLCSTSNGFLKQSLNGDISGCFRVPVLHSSAIVVALQAILLTTLSEPKMTTTTTGSTPTGPLSLTVNHTTVTPGETVTVAGAYKNDAPSHDNDVVNLCWAGCRTGLQESVQLHWTSRLDFHTTLVVPETAWLESSTSSVKVHPLRSGRYEVGIQCLGTISGCALGGADAQTTVQLKAPSSPKCSSGRRCASIHLSTTSASVGDVVNVSGWAPLQTIIGQPFGYDFSVTPGKLAQKYSNFEYSRVAKGGAFQVVLAPKVLRITKSETWADLGTIHSQFSTWSGPSPVNAQQNSDFVAWCSSSGVVVSDGRSSDEIPTNTAGAALAGSSLSMGSPASSSPDCETVLWDHRYPSTVYAGFGTEKNGSLPPSYLAGLYTTDAGATWHAVPPPPGNSLESFGGFTSEGDQVFALFADINSVVDNAPGGTTKSQVDAEVTSNGGRTWSPTTLGCPSSGPCTTFGPYNTGYCNMSNAPQSLLLGPAHAHKSTGVTWRSSTWVTSVNSCFTQQLVVASPMDLYLLDPSSQYQLLRSTNGGVTWSFFALPPFPGYKYSLTSSPVNNSLVLAPNGSLFAEVTTPNGSRGKLFLLKPFATSWCQVANPTGTLTSINDGGTLRVSATNLLWVTSHSPSGSNTSLSLHSVPLSQLTCAAK